MRELEEAIVAHPAVARAAAFGLPHKEKGEFPAAAVELHSGSTASESDLLDWCRQNLAAYKAPRRIWILEPGACRTITPANCSAANSMTASPPKSPGEPSYLPHTASPHLRGYQTLTYP